MWARENDFMTTGTSLPEFRLFDASGSEHLFPTGRPTVLCFAKHDCPTCELSMPLLLRMHEAFGDSVDVWAVSQDAEGEPTLIEEFGTSMPVLDDSSLAVSWNYGIETVPTIILTDGRGEELGRWWGFARDDWRGLVGRLESLTDLEPPAVDWDTYPEARPGCGSRSMEPGLYERLSADSAESPLRARRVDVADGDDVMEFLFDKGLTDGLPVVPPTPERVLRMLSGTQRHAQDVIAMVPPNLATVTVEKIAINAVMAGCRPEYLPVVIASIEAVCTDDFNIHGVMATTMGAAPVVVVNGPIRQRLGINMGLGCLGQGTRSNATIGRALRLVLRNVGGAKPGGTERSTFGSPSKFTLAFAEWEERSPWVPLHVERGFEPEDSVVTVYALSGGPSLVVDHRSRTAESLATSIALVVRGIQDPRAQARGDVLVVVSPEHVDTLHRDGWTKNDLREAIQGATSIGLRHPDLATPKFPELDYIHLVVAGGEAGKYTAVFEGWVRDVGSVPTSRKIED